MWDFKTLLQSKLQYMLLGKNPEDLDGIDDFKKFEMILTKCEDVVSFLQIFTREDFEPKVVDVVEGGPLRDLKKIKNTVNIPPANTIEALPKQNEMVFMNSNTLFSR